MNKNRALPSKEAGLFKDLLNLYETRQLKKGVKTADLILKKFPEHGETLAMKGLLLSNMGESAQGLALVKQGVRKDLTSHICWHVFGLIQRADKNYEEALKSYLQALKFDRDNLNLLRDAAQLQVHLRLYDGLLDTRSTLLKLRPMWRTHWVGLAVAYQLNGNLPQAIKVMEAYHRILKNVPRHDLSISETTLYQASLLVQSGDYTAALALLDSSTKSGLIIDKTAVARMRAQTLTIMGKTDEAEDAWKLLLSLNPDSREYLLGYLTNLGVTDPAQILAVLPKSVLGERVALDVVEGDAFVERAKLYIERGLGKGVPSLFVDLKPLYASPTKRQTIQTIVEQILNDSTDPATHLWSLYFLAQHHSHNPSSSPDMTLALDYLNRAIEHTPTLPDLHTLHARFLKSLSRPLAAAQASNAARLLDGQDRFLNTKTIKYLLRAGFISSAEQIAGLFTKKDASSPAADLEDMQSLLFLATSAEAYSTAGNLGMALKRWVAITKVFNEVTDDQFDFHSYSLRKFILEPYVSLVHWEDTLKEEDTYVRAAVGAVRIWISVFDDPNLAKAVVRDTTGEGKKELTDEEKKARKKAKKAQAAAQQKDKNNATSDEKVTADVPPKDDDPDGIKLLTSEDGLERAAKLLSPLLTSPSIKEKEEGPYTKYGLGTSEKKGRKELEIEIWLVGYDVAIRRGRILQSLKYLLYATQLSRAHPEVHIRIADLAVRVRDGQFKSPSDVLSPLITDLLSLLLPSNNIGLDRWNAEYLQQQSSSAPAVLASAKVAKILGQARHDTEGILFSMLSQPELVLDIAVTGKTYHYLKAIGSERAEEFREMCKQRFTYAETFMTLQEIEALRKEILKGLIPIHGSGEDD